MYTLSQSEWSIISLCCASVLAGACRLNKQTQLDLCRAPQMAHRLLLLHPAVEEQGEVYWLVLLIWCKQNVNLLMVTSTTALLLVMHLCSDPVPAGGGGGRGGHTTCGQTNIKGDAATLSSLLTCRPWSTLGAIHNNTQAGHYMRDIPDDNKQTNQRQRSTGRSAPPPWTEVKGQNIRAESIDNSFFVSVNSLSFLIRSHHASFSSNILCLRQSLPLSTIQINQR